MKESWYYTAAGQPSETVNQQQGAGTAVSDQSYAYDTDGDRTSSENGTHLYNALDQEVRWTRGGANTADPGGTVDYTYDGDGDLLRQHSLVSLTNAVASGISVPVNATQETTTNFWVS